MFLVDVAKFPMLYPNFFSFLGLRDDEKSITPAHTPKLTKKCIASKINNLGQFYYEALLMRL